MRDYEIRLALKGRLNEAHADEPETRIIEELGLRQGSFRADLAVVNGSLHGYEIKSDRDNLDRLPRQGGAYADCFDEATLVVGPRLVKAATAAIPEWWGVLLARPAEGGVALDVAREPARNPGVRPEAVVELLWRDEALAALRGLGAAAGLSQRPRRALWDALLEAVDGDELGRIVRRAIKARGDWRAEMRRARGNDSSPTTASPSARRANLDWLLSHGSPDRPR